MTDRLIAGTHCTDVADLAAGFVLGALEPTEMDAVRAHLAACPEPHPEFAELGSVVPALMASIEPVEPRPALRERILAAAAAATDSVEPAEAPLVSTPRREPTRLEERTRRSSLERLFDVRRPIWAGLGVAAVLAIVVLGASNLQLRSERDQLAAYERTVAEAVSSAATDPEVQLAVLAAPAIDSPTAGLAAVSTSAAKIHLAMRGLAPTSGAQVYEAWYIPAGGAPLPIGGFTVGSSGTGTISGPWSPPSGTTPGGTVAITLEPAGGATAPTTAILASGASS